MRRMETAYPSVAENGSHHFMAPCRRNGYPPRKWEPQEGAISGKEAGRKSRPAASERQRPRGNFPGRLAWKKEGGRERPGIPFRQGIAGIFGPGMRPAISVPGKVPFGTRRCRTRSPAFPTSSRRIAAWGSFRSVGRKSESPGRNGALRNVILPGENRPSSGRFPRTGR